MRGSASARSAGGTKVESLSAASLAVVIVAAVVAGVVPADTACAQPAGEPVVIGEKVAVQSETLNESRPLIIGTPRSYVAGDEHYPVLYLLDGDVHFHHTTATVNFLASNGRMPELIVVAIPNTDRTRDLSPVSSTEEAALNLPTHGGADNFLRFLRDELKPWVDQHYRTRPHSILVGHSLGGLFAIHALITQPEVFDAYIAISPSLQWDEQRLVAAADEFFENTEDLAADLYMTVGNEGGALLGGVRKLSGVLDEKAPRGFRWAVRLMEEETHNSVPLRSTRQGLEAIFDGWYLHDVMSLFDRDGLVAIEDHYRQSGVRFGYERTTPTSTLTSLTFALIDAERIDEAATVLMRDPETSPPPSTLLAMLASGYADRDQGDRAREFYTLALEANPGNEMARKRLTEMGVDVAALVPEVAVARDILATYVGRYQLAADNILMIHLDSGQLLIDDTPVFPMSQTKFFLKENDAQLSFNVNADGDVESATLHVFGQEHLAKRIE